jgi:hypothetical protein
MRKSLFLLLALWAGAGCLHLPFGDSDKPSSTLKPAPVIADQVKEVNAYKVADELDAEVKADETTPPPKPPAEEKKPAKKPSRWW